MTIILTTLAVSVLVGYLLGGRLGGLARLRLRWAPLAAVGLALQLVPGSAGSISLVLLYVSFALLAAFAIANARGGVPGAWLILVGLWLNFTVIAVNQGMPVSREALARSDQLETLADLEAGGGAKHHLTRPSDRLLFLADVIALGPPVRQALSPGDVVVYAGVAWMVVVGMQRGRATGGRRSARVPEVVPGVR
jgi:hypothetical protein